LTESKALEKSKAIRCTYSHFRKRWVLV